METSGRPNVLSQFQNWGIGILVAVALIWGIYWSNRPLTTSVERDNHVPAGDVPGNKSFIGEVGGGAASTGTSNGAKGKVVVQARPGEVTAPQIVQTIQHQIEAAKSVQECDRINQRIGGLYARYRTEMLNNYEAPKTGADYRNVNLLINALDTLSLALTDKCKALGMSDVGKRKAWLQSSQKEVQMALKIASESRGSFDLKLPASKQTSKPGAVN